MREEGTDRWIVCAGRIVIDPEARIEKARHDLLVRLARRDRTRALRPLIRRLQRDGFTASAGVLGIVARGGTVTRTSLVQVIDALLPRCGTFTKSESSASAAFRRLIDEATR